MILFNWLQCVEGKFNYARLNATDEDVLNDADVLAWEKIYDSYINHFGINALYKEYLAKAKKKAIAQLDYAITRKKIHFNVIRIMDVELEKLKTRMNQGVTTESVLVHLSKYMGFKQDPKKLTVKEYFSMIKEYERAN